MDASLSTVDSPSGKSLHEFFERKPDFVLPQEFFDGPTLEVLGSYCKQVRIHSKKAFDLCRDKRAVDVIFPGLSEFLLIAPAHCGYKECMGTAVCKTNDPDFNATAVNLVKKLKSMHAWVWIAYPTAQ